MKPLFALIIPSERKKKYSFLKVNCWLSVFFLEIFSVPLTLFLHKARSYAGWISPNLLSICCFLLFYTAILLMFLFPDAHILYTALFFMSTLCDDIDGQLARLSGAASRSGALVDEFVDLLNNLGLLLVGLVLSARQGALTPFWILLPYVVILTGIHLQTIGSLLKADVAGKPSWEYQPVTLWQRFCHARGMVPCPYTDTEAIFIGILLVVINLKEPNLVLLGVVGFVVVPHVIQLFRKVTRVLFVRRMG